MADPTQTNLDANESVFFTRQLEFVKARTRDVKYGNLNALRLIPVSTEGGAGVAEITYGSFDSVGIAKIVADYADDLPRADVKAIENTAKVKTLGASYGWNLMEIRRAARLGMPLQARKATAARRAIDTKQDQIAWLGDDAYGMVGLLNHPNITTGTVAADGTGNATEWTAKSADLIVRDIGDMLTNQRVLTKDVEMADTVLLPISRMALLARTRLPDTSVTVMTYLRQVYPEITTWAGIVELEDVDGAGTMAMVAYKRDPDHLELMIPEPFEQLEPEKRNLEWVVACIQRTAGVAVYYPLSVSMIDGI